MDELPLNESNIYKKRRFSAKLFTFSVVANMDQKIVNIRHFLFAPI